jgi:hypothetical protein
MSCEGWYFKGSPSSNDSIGLSDYSPNPKKYLGPVPLKETEWAYGSCKSSKEIQGAAYSFTENPEVSKRVKNQMQKMQEKLNKTSKTRPLTVINLFLDSISRKTFYRRLPKTISFLNNLNRKDFKLYDFKLHTSVADNSLPNLFPLWTGHHYSEKTRKEMQENKLKNDDLIYNISIWKDFKEKGWVSLFGVEFCNHYFAYGIGRSPRVDHLMSQFWCGARSMVGYSDTSHDQRCIGSKYSHEYLFEYLLQYTRGYKGLNKWAHVMCVTAHDDTGTVIATLDNDLSKFLMKLVESSDEFVLFFGADHGMRYGEWYKNENGGQEHRLPLMVMLARSTLVDRIEGADQALRYNSGMLMTKKDLFHVLKTLSVVPYTNSFNDDGSDGVDLLRFKIPRNRKCEDAGVPVEYCPCNQFQEVPSQWDPLTKQIAQLTIDEINESIYFNQVPAFQVCQRISLKAVQSAMWVSQGVKVLFKVNFTVNESPFPLESFSMIFSRYMKHKPREEGFKFLPFYLEGKRLFRLLGVNSERKSQCKDEAWSLGVPPELCICRG